jgi:hypothetical protein
MVFDLILLQLHTKTELQQLEAEEHAGKASSSSDQVRGVCSSHASQRLVRPVPCVLAGACLRLLAVLL